MGVDLNEYQTNLVPFPRLHFMSNSISPCMSKDKARNETQSFQDVTDVCVNPASFMIYYPDFDTTEDKYMAITLLYRGNVKARDTSDVVAWLLNKNKLAFVDWCPTGFKIGLNDEPPALVDDDDMSVGTINCSSLEITLPFPDCSVNGW